MKVAKIIFGVLASLFILMHLVTIPNFLVSLSQIPDHLRATAWIAKGCAMLIGSVIAIACLRPKKKDQPGAEAAPQEL